MHPRLGPSRCGELADIVVDEEGIHTPDDGARFAVPAAGGPNPYQTCRDWLDRKPNQKVNQIDGERLVPQLIICVGTDKQNIAVVQVERISLDPSGRLTAVTIGFTLWNRD